VTVAVEHLDDLTDGSPLDALAALRRHLAANLLAAEPKEVAGLSREFRAVLTELDKRGAGREVSEVNDIAAARNRRRTRIQKAAGT
jgi:hypothetical protein